MSAQGPYQSPVTRVLGDEGADEVHPGIGSDHDHRPIDGLLAVTDGDGTRDSVGYFDAVPVAVGALAAAGLAQVVLAHRLWSSAADSVRVREASGDSAAALSGSSSRFPEYTASVEAVGEASSNAISRRSPVMTAYALTEYGRTCSSVCNRPGTGACENSQIFVASASNSAAFAKYSA